MFDNRPVILLDLNGTVHAYRQGWQRTAPLYDEPTEGFAEWAESVRKDVRVAVWPTHMNTPRDIRLIKKWLRKHDLDKLGLEIMAEPPRGLRCKIDDRAMQFTGDWKDFPLERLLGFRTWANR